MKFDRGPEIIPEYPSKEYYRWYFCSSLAVAQIQLEAARTLGFGEDRIKRREEYVQGVMDDMKCQHIEYTAEDLANARFYAVQKAIKQTRLDIEEAETDATREAAQRRLTFYESLTA